MTQAHRALQAHEALKRLFEPSSIAVVGVSERAQSFGSATLANLATFAGRSYAINPKHDTLHSHACHPSVSALPEVPDCVILAVPRANVEGELQACIQAGVGGVVVFAAGYKETGDPRRMADEARLGALVRGSRTRLLGPNCLGFVNLPRRLNASFYRGLPEFGPVTDHAVGLISQSGAIGFGLAQNTLGGMSLSHMLTAGNSCDIDIADEIAYLAQSPACRSIACVFEGIAEPLRLIEAAELATRNDKTLVICRIGVGEAGAAAALSHTGSLTGSGAGWNALFERIGATVVTRIEDLLPVASFLAKAARPRADGAAVLASSGGAAIICADKAQDHAVPLPQPAAETARVLRESVPDFAHVGNPFDATAAASTDMQSLERCADALLADPAYATLVVPITAVNPATTPSRVALLERSARAHGKIACLVWIAGWQEGPGSKEAQASPHTALFRSPDTCFLALSTWWARSRRPSSLAPTQRLASDDARDRAGAVIASSPGAALTERTAKLALSAYGLPVTREALAIDRQQAIDIARQVGYPVAMKIESPDILHKTECGGVRLDVRDDAQVAMAFDEIMSNAARFAPNAARHGVLVQGMAPQGVEVLVGATVDPLFGPLITVGLGGTLVEILKDSVTALAPLSPAQAQAMLRSLRAAALFGPFRGRAAVQLDSVAETVARLSEFAADHATQVREVEVNPLICHADGAVVVDALIIKAHEA